MMYVIDDELSDSNFCMKEESLQKDLFQRLEHLSEAMFIDMTMMIRELGVAVFHVVSVKCRSFWMMALLADVRPICQSCPA